LEINADILPTPSHTFPAACLPFQILKNCARLQSTAQICPSPEGKPHWSSPAWGKGGGNLTSKLTGCLFNKSMMGKGISLWMKTE